MGRVGLRIIMCCPIPRALTLEEVVNRERERESESLVVQFNTFIKGRENDHREREKKEREARERHECVRERHGCVFERERERDMSKWREAGRCRETLRVNLREIERKREI